MFVLLGLGAAYVHFYFGPWLAEKGFETVIQSALGEKATISRTVVHWLGRPGIEYRGFSIGGTGEDGGWLRVERIVVRPKLRSLFSKSIRWKSLDLDHPVLRLSWKGRQSPLEYLLPILSQFDRLQVRRGKIEWHDREIQDLFVSLSNLSTSGPFPLVLGGALKAGNGFPAWVSVRGLIHNLSGKWDLSSLKLSAEIEAKGLDPFWFGGHFAQYIPSELTGSRITVMAKFDGDLKGRFQSFGTLSITGSRLFEEMGRLSANFSLNWDGQELEFQKIHLKIPDLPLEARGRIYVLLPVSENKFKFVSERISRRH